MYVAMHGAAYGHYQHLKHHQAKKPVQLLLLLFYSNSKFHVLGAAIRMYNNWTVYSTSLG